MLGDELGHAIVCYPNQIISGASLSNCDSSLGQFFKQQQNGCSRVLFSFSLLTHFTEPCWLYVTIQSSQVEQPSVEPTVDLTTIYLSTHSYYIPDLLLNLPHKVCSSPTKNPIRNHSIPFNLLCCFLKWYVSSKWRRWEMVAVLQFYYEGRQGTKKSLLQLLACFTNWRALIKF